ncbi:hypothetical protein GQ457_17G010020 [Hibiscus cannabinus]
MNRAYLDPESVSTRSSRTSTRTSYTPDYDDDSSLDDEICTDTVGDSISEVEYVSSRAMSDLKLIADCMNASVVRLQALNSLVRLSESLLSLLTDFESTIQKDSSKAMIAGGGLHPLKTYSMNYLTLLANYDNILTDIISDWPSPKPERSLLPEEFFDSRYSDESPAAISIRIAWLILVLLCKLDCKSKHYKDVSLSYVFLAKNLQHIISRVPWGIVLDSLQGNPTAGMTDGEAKECFKKFNTSFEDAYHKQSSCVVLDPKLRHKIKVSIGTKLVAVYREFHDTHKSTVEDESRRRSFRLKM